jgi:hypothetical protein
LAGERGNESPMPNFGFPPVRLGLISEIANRSDCNQRSAGALSPQRSPQPTDEAGEALSRNGINPLIAACARSPSRRSPFGAALDSYGQTAVTNISRKSDQLPLPAIEQRNNEDPAKILLRRALVSHPEACVCPASGRSGRRLMLSGTLVVPFNLRLQWCNGLYARGRTSGFRMTTYHHE